MKKVVLMTTLLLSAMQTVKADLIFLNNGQIQATASDSGKLTQYEYDPLGNITQDGSATYEYDDAGKLKRVIAETNKEFFYDDFGRLISDRIADIAYDSHNNMMSTYRNAKNKAEYLYDQLSGLRVQKTLNGIETRFVFDDLQRVIEERNQNDELISQIIWQGDLPAKYIVQGTEYQYVCNELGDVIELRDTEGKTVNTYTYDIWGKLIEAQEAIPNAIRYRHEYQDSESGFYYLRGRYYDPEIRRFTTPDPAEDGINWYTYCGNDPVKNIDPSGYAYYEHNQDLSKIIISTFYYSDDDIVDRLLDTTLSDDQFFKQKLLEDIAESIKLNLGVNNFLTVSKLLSGGQARLWDADLNRQKHEASLARKAKSGYAIQFTTYKGSNDMPEVSGFRVPIADIEAYQKGTKKPK